MAALAPGKKAKVETPAKASARKGASRLPDGKLCKAGTCNFDHDTYGHCVACDHVTSCTQMLYSAGAESCKKVCKGDSTTGDDDVYTGAKGEGKYASAAPAHHFLAVPAAQQRQRAEPFRQK